MSSRTRPPGARISARQKRSETAAAYGVSPSRQRSRNRASPVRGAGMRAASRRGRKASTIGPAMVDDNGVYTSMHGLLSEAFDDFDEDGNGYIDGQELDNLCKMLGSRLDRDQIQGLLQELDRDGNGSVDKEEFISWWMSTKGRAREALRVSRLGAPAGSRRSLSTESALLPQLPGAAPVRLLDARRNRKLTERDTAMLLNRIKLLKTEELKTLKRISDANKQAAQIYRRKKKQSSKLTKRVEHARNQLKANKTAQEHNYVKKELARISKLKAARAVVDQKYAAAQSVKDERKRLNGIKKKENDALMERRRHRKAMILQKRQELRESKLLREQQRAEQAELAYLSRVMHEQRVQRDKERRLRELEQTESELIGRLQSAHLMQEEALHSLGRVLTSQP